MEVVHLLTHPEVDVQPDVPVPDWSLSDQGQQRALAAGSLPWAAQVQTLFCSSGAQGCRDGHAVRFVIGKMPLVVRELGEVDRSSTGYLPHAEHEAIADQLFAHPAQSARGWDTAQHAQERVYRAVGRCLAKADEGNVALVAHGGVGALLLCRLLDVPIARSWDQSGQGSHWSFERATLCVLTRWERLPEPG